jgi:hypothetical protein
VGIVISFQVVGVLGAHLHGVDDQQALVGLEAMTSSIAPSSSAPRNTSRSEVSRDPAGAGWLRVVVAAWTT